MDDINVPEDLSGLTNEDLVEMAKTIDQRSAELTEGDLTPEVATEITDLADAYEAINAELVEREAAQAELREKAEAARRRISGEEAAAEEAEGDDETEGGDEAEAEAEAEAPAAEASEAEGEAEEAETEAASVEAAVEALVPEVLPTPKPRAQALLAELSDRQKAKAPETQPEVTDSVANPLDGVQLSATRLAGADYKAGESMSAQKLAEAITSKRIRMGTVPNGIHDERVTLATAEMPWDSVGRMLSNDEEKNFVTLRETQDEAVTLVASGGPCTPFPPRYDIFRLAQPQNPMEQKLPSLGAPRGGIKWIVPPDFREARAGVGTITCEEDEAGFGSGSGQATPKPCVHFDCPDTDECCVVTVSHCIEFGNLQFRVFPEWVEARIADLMVEFTSVKEVLYLDAVDSESIPTTTAPADGYGLARRVFSDAVRAAAAYRKRNGMNTDASLDWCIPSWLADAVMVDLINDHSLGVEVLLGGLDSAAFVGNLASKAKLSVSVYYDSATGEDQAFSALQGAGSLNDWPEDAVSYLFAPGTFIRLDGGTLDLGIVRDSILNRTNDLQIFAEEWTQVCKLGIESIKITHEGVCPNGAAPEPDSLIVCS